MIACGVLRNSSFYLHVGCIPTKPRKVIPLLSLSLVLLISLFFFTSCQEKHISTYPTITPGDKLYAYSNFSTILYEIDIQTFEVMDTINIPAPEGMNLHGSCLSTYHDYLIFNGNYGGPPFYHYVLSYDIKNRNVYTLFLTGLDSVGAPRIAPAMNWGKPGLFYLYSHSIGMYALDFVDQQIVELISDEHRQYLSKWIHHSPDLKYTVIHKSKQADSDSHGEIEFYKVSSGFQDTLFILNYNDVDSLLILDIVFSEDSEKLFLTYWRSQGRWGDAAHFGYYDLNSKEFHPSSIRLPWNINPYYLAYNPQRREVYTIGRYDQFYIIDANTSELAASVTINGKVPGPSRILVRPDGEIAFVSCHASEMVAVIDLVAREMIRTIPLDPVYKLVLP